MQPVHFKIILLSQISVKLFSLEIYKHNLVFLILGHNIVNVSREDMSSNNSIRVLKFNTRKTFQMARFA